MFSNSQHVKLNSKKEQKMKEVVIASACRTAIGTFGGTLKDSHAATIASVTMKAAVERSGIDPDLSTAAFIVTLAMVAA